MTNTTSWVSVNYKENLSLREHRLLLDKHHSLLEDWREKVIHAKRLMPWRQKWLLWTKAPFPEPWTRFYLSLRTQYEQEVSKVQEQEAKFQEKYDQLYQQTEKQELEQNQEWKTCFDLLPKLNEMENLCYKMIRGEDESKAREILDELRQSHPSLLLIPFEYPYARHLQKARQQFEQAWKSRISEIVIRTC